MRSRQVSDEKMALHGVHIEGSIDSRNTWVPFLYPKLLKNLLFWCCDTLSRPEKQSPLVTWHLGSEQQKQRNVTWRVSRIRASTVLWSLNPSRLAGANFYPHMYHPEGNVIGSRSWKCGKRGIRRRSDCVNVEISRDSVALQFSVASIDCEFLLNYNVLQVPPFRR